jgi:glycosyltransferase involved in cell wall biosynthesis
VAVKETRPLRINYLLEDTTLFGGVKIPLHHANLLHGRGYEVRVVSRGASPDWFALEAPFVTVPDFSGETVPEADLNIATYWTTIAPAADLPFGQAVHYCQGFEASYTHNQDEHPQILEAYSLPIPAFALSPHLAEIVSKRFQRPVRLVPPALERVWRPRLRLGPGRPPRVLILHPFEIDWKGVQTALAAVKLIRQSGLDTRVIRVSQWPLIDAERELVEPDEFHCHLDPKGVARVMAESDVLLAPSWGQEGFGLPVIEAMACGLPVVASRIPAFEGSTGGAVELVSSDDPEAFADAARRILSRRSVWRRHRRAGIDAAARFAVSPVMDEVEAAIRWAVDREWENGR